MYQIKALQCVCVCPYLCVCECEFWQIWKLLCKMNNLVESVKLIFPFHCRLAPPAPRRRWWQCRVDCHCWWALPHRPLSPTPWFPLPPSTPIPGTWRAIKSSFSGSESTWMFEGNVKAKERRRYERVDQKGEEACKKMSWKCYCRLVGKMYININIYLHIDML